MNVLRLAQNFASMLFKTSGKAVDRAPPVQVGQGIVGTGLAPSAKDLYVRESADSQAKIFQMLGNMVKADPAKDQLRREAIHELRKGG